MITHPSYLLAPAFIIILLLNACSSPDDQQSDLQNVFGTDDRVAVPDQYPYRAVGRLDSGCTGTLISDKLVLTGAHCVVDSRTGSVKENLGWFRPNLRNNDMNGPKAWMVRAWVGSENPDGNRLRDYAVVELDEALGQRFGTLSVRVFDIAAQLPFRTDLVGYSADRDNGATATLHSGCNIREIVEDRLFHECDGTAGVSGGPLLNSNAGTFYISGMTVSEFRQGAASSVTRDTYSKEYANVALSAKNFSGLVSELLATVVHGRPAPVIPDITLKLNPNQRPDIPVGGSYTVDKVAAEQSFTDNELVFSRMFEDLKYEANHLAQWANGINDPRLNQLARQLENDFYSMDNVVKDTARSFYRGQHKEPVFQSWTRTAGTIRDLNDFPRTSGRTALQEPMQHQLSSINDIMQRLEALIFD